MGSSFLNHGGKSTQPNTCSYDQPKFLVLHADDDSKLTTLSPFLVSKAILGMAGNVRNTKKLPSGDLLVETATPAQSQNLLKTKMLAHIPITVTPHTTLNSTKGVIYCPDLIPIEDDEIKTELASQGVSDVHRITTKIDGKTKSTPLFILTFCKTSLPNEIMIGYLCVKTRPYIPNPLRCFRCQRFGHGTAACRGTPTCNKCGSVKHASDTCIAVHKKCVNCEGEHEAYSKKCPKWLQEKEIQRVKVLENLSYGEARRRVHNIMPPRPSTSYASAAAPVKSYNTIAIQTTISLPEKPFKPTPETVDNSKLPQEALIADTPPSNPTVAADSVVSMDVEQTSNKRNAPDTAEAPTKVSKPTISTEHTESNPIENAIFELSKKDVKNDSGKPRHKSITFSPGRHRSRSRVKDR